MYNLSRVQEATLNAPRITIFGVPGIGKTTFACEAPNPVILSTESGLPAKYRAGGEKPIPIIPIFTYADVINTLEEILAHINEIPYDTIIIDSVTQLDALIQLEFIKNDPSQRDSKIQGSAMGAGKFGVGATDSKLKHDMVVKLGDKIAFKGKTVIYIAHSMVVKLASPDEETYTQYSLQFENQKSAKVYLNNPDAVLYAHFEINVATSKGTKKIQATTTGDRRINTGKSATAVSKNRFDLPDDIELKWVKFAEHVRFYQLKAKAAKAAQEKKAEEASKTPKAEVKPEQTPQQTPSKELKPKPVKASLDAKEVNNG